MKHRSGTQWMTDGEIREMYRHSKDPDAQVKILADLNCMTEEAIANILGITLRERKKRVRNYKKWTPEEENTACEMYAGGSTLDEIAQRIGREKTAVDSKLSKIRGLTRHADKAQKAAESPEVTEVPEAAPEIITGACEFDSLPKPTASGEVTPEFANELVAFVRDRLGLKIIGAGYDIEDDTASANFKNAAGIRYYVEFSVSPAQRKAAGENTPNGSRSE